MTHLPDHYTYPAILQKTNGHYGVYFPDLPGCIATGATADEAAAAAKEGLSLHLWGMEQDLGVVAVLVFLLLTVTRVATAGRIRSIHCPASLRRSSSHEIGRAHV